MSSRNPRPSGSPSEPGPFTPAETPINVAHDCLLIGGETVESLARRAGATPFFVYDRAAIRARVAALRAAIPEQVQLHYSIKANPFPPLVAFMSGLVDGMDVASAGELGVALEGGIRADRISFAGPGKTDSELKVAARSGALINLESAGETERLAVIATSEGLTPRVAVRVNPDFELEASGLRMGGGAKPFGVDAEAVPSLLRRIATLPLAFEGFHIYGGSQSLSVDAITLAQTRTLDLALDLARAAPCPPRSINIGGGFGIPYFPGERALDMAPIGRHLKSLARRAQASIPGVTLALELGRWLTGEAGYYVCRIVDRKESRGELFLITDGGLHHHLRASGNYGQCPVRSYPVVAARHVHAGPREIVNVTGRLCTPLDRFAKGVELGRCEVGDFVVVLQSGAYGPTASPGRFLGHPEAVEILV